MEITFEITDCTTLCGKREQNIIIKNLNCSSDNLDFVHKLTENIKEFTIKYIEERNEKNES